MRTASVLATALALLGMLDPTRGNAAAAPEIRLRKIATLEEATAMAARPNSPVLYVATQGGAVYAIRRDKLVSEPVLDLGKLVTSGGEQGLLGLVFSPDGTKLYVHYSDVDGNTAVDELSMTGDAPDPDSRREILRVEQPQENHNGGQLAFGPDGYLYLGLGDGGAADDEGEGHARGGNGQSLATLLGKILRIDPTPSGADPYRVPADNPFVGVDDAKPEIWAYGLRNPWRFSFDRDTGDLWIGDVGQDEVEEIDHSPATDGVGAGRGVNYGWNRLEGTHEFRGKAPGDAVPPVYEILHDTGACSVTGGFVYRGNRIPALRDHYLFSDYCDGTLRALAPDGDGFEPIDLGHELAGVSSFGQADNGTLYVLSQPDGVFKILPG